MAQFDAARNFVFHQPGCQLGQQCSFVEAARCIDNGMHNTAKIFMGQANHRRTAHAGESINGSLDFCRVDVGATT